MAHCETLNKYGFKEEIELEKILDSLDLQLNSKYQFQIDKFTNKLDGIVGIKGRGEIHLQIKKMHDLRYPTLLPSLLESYLDSKRENKEFLLIIRAPKAPNSVKSKVDEFLSRYSSGNDKFNWILVDEVGHLIGSFQNKEIKKNIHFISFSFKNFTSFSSTKEVITFSPIQQWLLKCLLLNGIETTGSNLWNNELIEGLGDYKKLSNFSGVSSSSCFNFIKLLQESNYLSVDEDGNYRFKNLDDLFQIWTNKLLNEKREEAYLTPIKPLMTIEDWRQSAIVKFKKVGQSSRPEIVMGGHLATKALGISFSNESSVIFYTSSIKSPGFQSFLKEMKLRFSETNEEGILVNIQKTQYPVMKLLNFKKEDRAIADPIQLYFDVQYFGARGKEQSEFIYNKVLLKHFRRFEWQR